MSDAVVDASALLLGLEPDGEAARRALVLLAEERRLVGPLLLAWELGHVIHRKHPARYGRTHDQRQDALEAALLALTLLAPDTDALRRTAALASRHALSFYDAAYLEVAAREEGSVLMTADRDLLRVARRVIGKTRALTVDEAALLGTED